MGRWTTDRDEPLWMGLVLCTGFMLIRPHGAAGSAASRVLGHVRRAGVARREFVVDATGLSAATVSRTISALIEAQLLTQRPDMARSGAIGRPSVPVQVDRRRHGVLGAHVGRLATSVGLADLNGRLVDVREYATGEDVDAIVGDLLAALDSLRAASPDRSVLTAGLVAPWLDLGVDQRSFVSRVETELGLPVASAEHVTAIASAEHTVGRQGTSGQTAYVYARDTIGFVVAHDDAERTTISSTSRLTHFPTGSSRVCSCRKLGCLEATASDEALVRRAHAEGLIAGLDSDLLYEAAEAGSARAHAILMGRAGHLARAAAFVRDMVDPDHTVLLGRAFTRYAPARDRLVEVFEDASTEASPGLSFGNYGEDLQPIAASAIALGPVYEEPLALVSYAAESSRL